LGIGAYIRKLSFDCPIFLKRERWSRWADLLHIDKYF
jgi:hypothetical protein